MKSLVILLSLISFNFGISQSKELKGIIIASGDVEGIHIINKTSRKNTTSNNYGVFDIEVKLNDTLLFSSVQYEKKTVIISSKDIQNELFTITLKDRINELDEVIIGEVLTGNLGSDVANSKAKQSINFYDVGIPGYKGPKKTYRERDLFDADGGSWINDLSSNGLGAGGGLNLNKLLNKISGRTKKLKRNLNIERKSNLLKTVREQLTNTLFELYPLDVRHHAEFFFFCSEDEDFLTRCAGTELETLKFLEEKLKQYKTQINYKD